MYEIPLTYVFGVWGSGRAFVVLRFWALAFCLPQILLYDKLVKSSATFVSYGTGVLY